MTARPDRDDELNPHRVEDRERAATVAASQLRQRGVDVDESESSDALATVLSAVERFKQAVAALGGDSMTNAIDSDEHDDESMVLPTRRDDERLADYAGRVTRAAEQLEGRRS